MKNKHYKHSGMELQQDRVPFVVSHKQHVINEFPIYLFGEIQDASDFLSTIEALNTATPEDIVCINLSSVGGSLYATDTLLFEIRKAQERGIEVGVSGSGLIASAGSLILLAATYFELSEDAVVMLHCGSLGDGGTLAEFKAASTFHIKHMESIFTKHYKHFLSDEEIQQLINGKDFWLTASEFENRFKQRNELLMQEMKEAELCSEPEEAEPFDNF